MGVTIRWDYFKIRNIMKEQNILKRIMLSVSSKGKIFRNNVGVGWTGVSKVVRSKTTVTLYPGDAVIRQARPLRAGLAKGSSDLIGWTPKVITQDMVGKEVAIFTAIEVKNEKGRIRPEQAIFIDLVRKNGGYAGIARSEEDADEILGI